MKLSESSMRWRTNKKLAKGQGKVAVAAILRKVDPYDGDSEYCEAVCFANAGETGFMKVGVDGKKDNDCVFAEVLAWAKIDDLRIVLGDKELNQQAFAMTKARIGYWLAKSRNEPTEKRKMKYGRGE